MPRTLFFLGNLCLCRDIFLQRASVHVLFSSRPLVTLCSPQDPTLTLCPCRHPLFVLSLHQEHPSKLSRAPALSKAERTAGEGSQQVKVRIKSGGSSIHTPLHTSVPTLLCFRQLLLLFSPTRPLHLCFVLFQSLLSEFALSPIHSPLVPQQLPPPAKCSALAHLFCCPSINSLRPCSAPPAAFPHLLFISCTMPAFLSMSRRKPTSYQLILGRCLIVGHQWLEPSCIPSTTRLGSCSDQHTHEPHRHFPRLISS